MEQGAALHAGGQRVRGWRDVKHGLLGGGHGMVGGD